MKIFEGIYLGSRPAAPGFAPRVMSFQQDDGIIKDVRIDDYSTFKEILEYTGIKKGDRVNVRTNDLVYFKILDF